jgi:hypothetical protein
MPGGISTSRGWKRRGLEKVDIRPFKAFALRRLPAKSQLRELILSEKDMLPAWELAAYTRMWLRLLEIEARAEGTAPEG